MAKKDCIFCKIARKEIKKEPLVESNNFVAFEDIHPINPGHMLVITKKHCGTLLDVPNTLGQELLEFTKKIIWDLMEKKKGDGFNVLVRGLEAGGQEVPHFHLHIIPRKEGDDVRSLPV